MGQNDAFWNTGGSAGKKNKRSVFTRIDIWSLEDMFMSKGYYLWKSNLFSS